VRRGNTGDIMLPLDGDHDGPLTDDKKRISGQRSDCGVLGNHPDDDDPDLIDFP